MVVLKNINGIYKIYSEDTKHKYIKIYKWSIVLGMIPC